MFMPSLLANLSVPPTVLPSSDVEQELGVLSTYLQSECRPVSGCDTYSATLRHGASLIPERECCLLVLDLVSSTLPCIRQPRPRSRPEDDLCKVHAARTCLGESFHGRLTISFIDVPTTRVPRFFARPFHLAAYTMLETAPENVNVPGQPK